MTLSKEITEMYIDMIREEEMYAEPFTYAKYVDGWKYLVTI